MHSGPGKRRRQQTNFKPDHRGPFPPELFSLFLMKTSYLHPPRAQTINPISQKSIPRDPNSPQKPVSVSPETGFFLSQNTYGGSLKQLPPYVIGTGDGNTVYIAVIQFSC
jgi:hypothetical protein